MILWLRSWTGISIFIGLIVVVMLSRSSRELPSVESDSDQIPLVPQIEPDILEQLPESGWGLLIDRDRGVLSVYRDKAFCGSSEEMCGAQLGSYDVYFGERFGDLESGRYTVGYIYMSTESPVDYEAKDGVWHSFHYWVGLSVPSEDRAKEGFVYALTEISSADEEAVINGAWSPGNLPGTFLTTVDTLAALFEHEVVHDGLIIVLR